MRWLIDHLLSPNTTHWSTLGARLAQEWSGFAYTSGTTQSGQWKPSETLTWYWQLQGTVNNSESVAAYDIDGFENSASEVSTLHAKAIKAICYIDVGTWEEWRPDASSFPTAVKGKNNGWPGEKYLDIRALSTLEPIMTKRFEMCRSKGFDAVEPDNMDTFEGSTGFPLTGASKSRDERDRHASGRMVEGSPRGDGATRPPARELGGHDAVRT